MENKNQQIISSMNTAYRIKPTRQELLQHHKLLSCYVPEKRVLIQFVKRGFVQKIQVALMEIFHCPINLPMQLEGYTILEIGAFENWMSSLIGESDDAQKPLHEKIYKVVAEEEEEEEDDEQRYVQSRSC